MAGDCPGSSPADRPGLATASSATGFIVPPPTDFT
jgi:hypothetical protein